MYVVAHSNTDKMASDIVSVEVKIRIGISILEH